MTKKRKTYSTEFKESAVKLAEEVGPQEAANQLGVCKASISIWKRNLTFSGNASSSDIDWEKEAKKLQKENSYLKKINDVLKKSTAIFSQSDLPGSK